MNCDDIRQLFLNEAVEYHTKHLMPKYNALEQAADYFYCYCTGRAEIRTPYICDFRERVFSFIFGDNKALTTEELNKACRYFIPLKRAPYGKETFDEYYKALEAYRAYVKELEDKTADLCKLDNGCFPFQILSRIEDYIKYQRIRGIEENLIYASVYNIGRADGIRAERARRKNKAAPTSEEVTA